MSNKDNKNKTHMIRLDHWTYAKLDHLEDITSIPKSRIITILSAINNPQDILRSNIKFITERFKTAPEETEEDAL